MPLRAGGLLARPGEGSMPDKPLIDRCDRPGFFGFGPVPCHSDRHPGQATAPLRNWGSASREPWTGRAQSGEMGPGAGSSEARLRSEKLGVGKECVRTGSSRGSTEMEKKQLRKE